MPPPVPEQYIRTASDREAIARGYWWSEKAIAHVHTFGSTLRNPMEPERPYQPLTWFDLDIIHPLFGWRRPDGRRRFTALDCWIPKKNGKTSGFSFLGLYFLCADGEPRPGCYATSANGRLANELYDEAKAMTAGTRWRQILAWQNFLHKILAPNGGVFAALAASAEGTEGLKGFYINIDEIHATLARNPRLYSALRYAGSGRLQPLVAMTSTAGEDRQSLPFKIYSRDKAILAGDVIDLHTLPIVYEAADKKEYTPEELAAANPAVGETLSLQQLVDDYESAKTTDYALEDFKRYRLNVWCKRSTAWLDAATWQAGKSQRPADILGRSAFGGVDLADVGDLAAACIVVPRDDGHYWFELHFWLPRNGVYDRGPREMKYAEAEAAGYLTLCPGGSVDYGLIREWFREKRQAFSIHQIGFDPWKAKQLADGLETDGFECLKVTQGWMLSEPARRFESLLRDGKAGHDGNSVMSWCVGNVEVRSDGQGKIRPVKAERYRKIDGVLAALMALYLAMFAKPSGGFNCG